MLVVGGAWKRLSVNVCLFYSSLPSASRTDPKLPKQERQSNSGARPAEALKGSSPGTTQTGRYGGGGESESCWTHPHRITTLPANEGLNPSSSCLLPPSFPVMCFCFLWSPISPPPSLQFPPPPPSLPPSSSAGDVLLLLYLIRNPS